MYWLRYWVSRTTFTLLSLDSSYTLYTSPDFSQKRFQRTLYVRLSMDSALRLGGYGLAFCRAFAASSRPLLAVPKSKVTPSRKGMRSANKGLKNKNYNVCPTCDRIVEPHFYPRGCEKTPEDCVLKAPRYHQRLAVTNTSSQWSCAQDGSILWQRTLAFGERLNIALAALNKGNKLPPCISSLQKHSRKQNSLFCRCEVLPITCWKKLYWISDLWQRLGCIHLEGENKLEKSYPTKNTICWATLRR